jgi:hypothetical protein
MASSTKIKGMSQKIIDRAERDRGASVGPVEAPTFDLERLTPEQRRGHEAARAAIERRKAEAEADPERFRGRGLRVRIGDDDAPPESVDKPAKKATKKKAAKKATKKKAAKPVEHQPDDEADDDDDAPVDLDEAKDVTHDDEGAEDGDAGSK